MHSRAYLLFLPILIAVACSGEPAPPVDFPAEVPTTVSATTATDLATTRGTDAPPTTRGTVASTTSAATTAAPAPDSVSLAYEPINLGVAFPVFMTPLPGTDLSVIATKAGRLWLFDGADVSDAPFLDIVDRVRNDGEQGLLGLAFSPGFTDSGRFLVHYIDLNGDTVLSEFTAIDLTVDPGTEVMVFVTDQPAANHNGGMIQFGPDGLLYMGLGDGGRANDAFGNAQNRSTPLGAILRFDVSIPGVATPAPGNPFEAAEVWAIGLRNPWRFTIDAASGLILIADVGQSRFEEVSAALLSEPGVNYGWPITEGLHCFGRSSECDVEGLTLPVVEVAHGDAGSCSITGGVVYRGTVIPELGGHYFFSDFCGGYLRSFPVDSSFDVVVDWTEQVGDAGRVVSFGTDSAGEVYVLNIDGVLLKIVRA